MNENPYSAPNSIVDKPTDPKQFELHPPRRVPASHGGVWLASGWAMFSKNPGTWLGITVVYVLINLVPTAVSFISYSLGNIVSIGFGLLAFIWAGGLMLGCRALDSGEALTFTHLFAGFKNRPVSLLLLGFFILVVFFLIGAAVVAVMAAPLLNLGVSDVAQIDPTVFFDNPTLILLPILVILLLSVPVIMLVWFAPALIVFNNVSLVDSVTMSFKACLINTVPFLIYGLVFLLISIFVLLVIGIAVFAAGFAGILFYLAAILISVPVVIGSIYDSYKDIFIET